MNGIKIGVIGGTGLGTLLAQNGGERLHVQTPFGPTSDAIVQTEWDGLEALLLSRHGHAHLLNPTHVPYRANIFALKQLGCTHIFATGAVGSLRQEMKPRDLVIADQVIDKTNRRVGTFYEKAAVHVEFAEPFCPVLRKLLIAEKAEAGSTGSPQAAVHDRGCYVCMEGPAFSTRAESLMHRLWGGDLIGMTAMPEAKLAREAEIPYALVALVTDYDCWRGTEKPGKDSGALTTTLIPTLIDEILGNIQAASSAAMDLIRRTLRRIAAEPGVLSACPAREALKLAIWSDKSKMDAEEIQRLSPLWGIYFR